MPGKTPPTVTEHQIISEVLAVFPQAVNEFVVRRMACPGCPMAKFETMVEAARNYGVEPRELLAAMALRLPKKRYVPCGKEMFPRGKNRKERKCRSH